MNSTNKLKPGFSRASKEVRESSQTVFPNYTFFSNESIHRNKSAGGVDVGQTLLFEIR